MAYAQKAMRYVFQDSELDDQNYMLRRGGIPAKVEPKVFEVLVYLIRQRDRFVSREELFTQLWPDHVVSDAALTRCVAEARKAVGDNGVKQEVIRTQYTRGYRFIAEVVERSEAAAHLQPVSLVQSVGESVSHSLSVDERFVECHEDVLQTISYFPAVFAKRSWLQGLCAVVGVLVVAGSLFSHQPAPFVQFPAFVSVEPETARAGAPVTGGAYAQRIFGHLKTSLDASRYTQQGWDYYFRYTPETNARARRAFERAIALGPHVANAYIGLGWTSWLEWVWLWSHDPDLLEEAHGLASKALSLQPSAPSAHALLAVVYLAKKRYEPALTAASRAVELDRHDVGEIVILAEVLISTGQRQAALTVLKEARAHSCGRIRFSNWPRLPGIGTLRGGDLCSPGGIDPQSKRSVCTDTAGRRL